MLMLILRGLVVAVIVVAVAELALRHPRLGALLLSLPLTSILAFTLASRTTDPLQLQAMARDTLVLVPLGLPFFVPLALQQRLGWSVPVALVVGLVLAGLTTGAWLRWGPQG